MRQCGEACDDGDLDECTAACNATCDGAGITSVCGDHVLQCNEASDEGDPSVNDGWRFHKAGDLAAAAAVFESLVRCDPEHRRAHEGLVWTYKKQGEESEAVRMADRRRDIDPDDEVWLEKWAGVVFSALLLVSWVGVTIRPFFCRVDPYLVACHGGHQARKR